MLTNLLSLRTAYAHSFVRAGAVGLALALGFIAWRMHQQDRLADLDLSLGSLVELDPAGIKELGIVTAEVSFVFGDELQVPSSSVVNVDGEPHAFVKDFTIPNAFLRVPVEVPIQEGNGDSATIINGLFPGDELVVVGAEMLGSERAKILSREALARYLDISGHVAEHPQQSNLQRWFEPARSLTGLLFPDRQSNSLSHAQ